MVASDKDRQSAPAVTCLQPAQPPIKRDYVLNPITALAFCKLPNGRILTLVAEDVSVLVFDVRSSELLAQIQIFNQQPIHGIFVPPQSSAPIEHRSKVLIWGAQYVAILPPGAIEAAIKDSTCPTPQEWQAPDWIYDGLLSTYDDTSGVLVTAHNEIIPISFSKDGSKIQSGPPVTPSRPILYSASLSWISEGCVLVIGGTAFGEILVWKYYHRAQGNCSHELLFVFAGHEGSVFGISVSPELELAPGVKIRLLASCSDDRTIRVWDITERAEDRLGRRDVVEEARETGFGPNSTVAVHPDDSSSRCVAVAMGHVSRIWHVKFSGRKNQHAPRETSIDLFSFSEDATRIAWKLDINKHQSNISGQVADAFQHPLSGTIREHSTYSCHVGKNIWSVAVLDGQDSDPLTVTGGADSKVTILGGLEAVPCLHDGISAQLSDGHVNPHLILSLGDILPPAGVKKDCGMEGTILGNKNKEDTFKNYAFISNDSLILTTLHGRIFVGSMVKEPPAWSEVSISEECRSDLQRYSVICSPAKDVAVLGAVSGQLYMYQATTGLSMLPKLGGKIVDIMPLSNYHPAIDGETMSVPVSVLVTIIGRSEATIITVDAGSSSLNPQIITIDPEQPFVVTAAGVCGGWLVLGSRTGAVALYRRAGEAFIRETLRRDTTSRESITSVVALPGSSASFLATCRDGRYRIYTVRGTLSEGATLTLQHETSPPLTYIEEAWFTEKGDHGIQLILCGFKGGNFIFWNETMQQEVASIQCGGAVRSYACISNLYNPASAQFVCTRAGKMHIYRQKRTYLRTLKAGGHGREIKTVAFSGKYLATAAEDTTIRIWKYHDSKNPLKRGLRCLAVAEKHTAGVQCLKWFSLGDSLWLLSSSGNEEFYIWRITNLNSEYDGLALVCEATYTDRTRDGDLRILDFDVQYFQRQSQSGLGLEEGMLIPLVSSNSVMKAYLYRLDGDRQGSFELLAEGRYTGAAMTQIRVLPSRARPQTIHCLTASTDGYLAIWNIEPSPGERSPAGRGKLDFSLTTAAKLHQNCIKSIDLFSQDGRILVATGGDDNALGFAEILESDMRSPQHTIVSKSRVKTAHAAAVTGVCILGKAPGGGVNVASVGGDQKLKIWRIKRTIRDRGIEIALLEDKYSSVADLGGVVPFQLNGQETGYPEALMAAGVGMELWNIGKANNSL